MPDFTKIDAAEQDIERKVNHSRSRCIALRRVDGQAAWEPIPGFWDNDGVLKRYWAPYDYGDGVDLRIKIAEKKPITRAILDAFEGFVFWRDFKKFPGEVWIYTITDVGYPETYANKLWTFSCQRLQQYRAVVHTSEQFDYLLDAVLG